MNPRLLICYLHGDIDSIPLFSNVASAPASKSAYDILDEQELKWRDRYHFFLERGFMLRPRYAPGWTPSWIGKPIDPWQCEDAIVAFLPSLLDAHQVESGRAVCIKMITKRTHEVAIAIYLSSASSQDSTNHCVFVFDSFPDPICPDVHYLVMPLLRPFDDPDFAAVGEVIDFTTQTLEGMTFMHSKLVAHVDLTGPNIMMDASPIIPGGWHFRSPSFSPNRTQVIAPLARIDNPVRYVIIDYDCSVRFFPGQSPIIEGLGGRDNDPPELAAPRRPFDHFKLDVFTLGNVFLKDFRQKYLGLDFLDSLIKIMMTRDFHQRPTAQQALEHWYEVKSNLSHNISRLRLRKPDASVSDTLMHTLADGIVNLAWLFDGEESKSLATT